MPPPSCRLIIALLLPLLLGACGQNTSDCALTVVARLPLEVQDDLLVVPAGVDGRWIRLVVDTGAERTTITEAAAERLHLTHNARYTTRSTGVGGSTSSTDVSIDRLVMGGVRFPLEHVAVAPFSVRSEHGLSADGLLGADILLAFDLDIDVPGGALTLYRPLPCPLGRLPWQEAAIEIEGIEARKDRLLVPVEIDGVADMAILDTGAQRTVIGAALAGDLDLSDQSMEEDPLVVGHGIGPGAVTARLHQFKRLRIGPVTRTSPRLTVMTAATGLRESVLGLDVLRGRRIWLSFRNRQLYVSAYASGAN